MNVINYGLIRLVFFPIVLWLVATPFYRGKKRFMALTSPDTSSEKEKTAEKGIITICGLGGQYVDISKDELTITKEVDNVSYFSLAGSDKTVHIAKVHGKFWKLLGHALATSL